MLSKNEQLQIETFGGIGQNDFIIVPVRVFIGSKNFKKIDCWGSVWLRTIHRILA